MCVMGSGWSFAPARPLLHSPSPALPPIPYSSYSYRHSSFDRHSKAGRVLKLPVLLHPHKRKGLLYSSSYVFPFTFSYSPLPLPPIVCRYTSFKFRFASFAGRSNIAVTTTVYASSSSPNCVPCLALLLLFKSYYPIVFRPFFHLLSTLFILSPLDFRLLFVCCPGVSLYHFSFQVSTQTFFSNKRIVVLEDPQFYSRARLLYHVIASFFSTGLILLSFSYL